jgi:hypothetical protein
VGLFLGGTGGRDGGATLYSQKQPLAIQSVAGKPTVGRFQVEEIRVSATGTYDNPFDSTDVRLDAWVTPPKSKPYSIPGFLSQDFQSQLVGSAETLDKRGEPVWKIRVAPTEIGHYSVKIVFKDHSGSVDKSFRFESGVSQEPGPVQVSSTDSHYFQTQTGATYFPIGANVGWAGPRGTFDYQDWLGDYGKNRCNFGRLLLGPSWSTFALERKGNLKQGLGAGMIDLQAAWKLDRVLAVAGEDGLNLELCLDSDNEFRIRDNRPDWPENPLNRDNGGPLRVWSDFWSNPASERIYEDKLRYLVARYSANEHVMAWELWNDVDHFPEYDPAVGRAWHAHIARTLKAMDPYHHLITTSFSQPFSDRDTFLLADLDFSTVHVFSSSFVGVIADVLQRRSDWGKPSFVEVVAGDLESPHSGQDLLGVQVHDPQWISLATGGAGSAAPWFWDSLIAKNNLYGLFSAFGAFVQNLDFGSEQFRPTASQIQPPTLNVWSLIGNDVALAWVQPKRRSWQSVVLENSPITPTEPSVVTLSDLAEGEWTVEVWDTWKGTPTTSFAVHVGLDGKAVVHIAGFTRDVALKLRRSKA